MNTALGLNGVKTFDASEVVSVATKLANLRLWESMAPFRALQFVFRLRVRRAN